MGVIRVFRIGSRHTYPQSPPLHDDCRHLSRAGGHVPASRRALRQGRGSHEEVYRECWIRGVKSYCVSRYACSRKDRTTGLLLSHSEGCQHAARGVRRICECAVRLWKDGVRNVQARTCGAMGRFTYLHKGLKECGYQRGEQSLVGLYACMDVAPEACTAAIPASDG